MPMLVTTGKVSVHLQLVVAKPIFRYRSSDAMKFRNSNLQVDSCRFFFNFIVLIISPKITVMLEDKKKKVGTEEYNARNRTTSPGKEPVAKENRFSAQDTGKEKSEATTSKSQYVPITGRTYTLETRRKGSSKGYKIVAGKHFKLNTLVKPVK